MSRLFVFVMFTHVNGFVIFENQLAGRVSFILWGSHFGYGEQIVVAVYDVVLMLTG